jgi:hypothetical protein
MTQGRKSRHGKWGPRGLLDEWRHASVSYLYLTRVRLLARTLFPDIVMGVSASSLSPRWMKEIDEGTAMSVIKLTSTPPNERE